MQTKVIWTATSEQELTQNPISGDLFSKHTTHRDVRSFRSLQSNRTHNMCSYLATIAVTVFV